MWYNKIHGRPMIQCGTIKYMTDLFFKIEEGKFAGDRQRPPYLVI